MSYVYVADVDFIPAPPCNEEELEWIRFEQLLTVPTPKTDWYIYEYLLRGKPFAFNAEYDDQLNLLIIEEELEGVIVFQA